MHDSVHEDSSLKESFSHLAIYTYVSMFTFYNMYKSFRVSFHSSRKKRINKMSTYKTTQTLTHTWKHNNPNEKCKKHLIFYEIKYFSIINKYKIPKRKPKHN